MSPSTCFRLDNLLPTRRNKIAAYRTQEDRLPLIKNMLTELSDYVLPRPDIVDMKKADLYWKWRPLLPKEYQDITCPHPGDEVLNKIRDERRLKSKEYNAKCKEMATKSDKKPAKPTPKPTKTASKKV